MLAGVQLHRSQPGLQQSPGIAGSEVTGLRTGSQLALSEHPFDDPEDRLGVRPAGRGWLAERPDGQGDGGVGPFGGASLIAVRGGLPGLDIGQELLRPGGDRRLGVGPADVDACVVVAAADRRSPMCLDVQERGPVQLLGAESRCGSPRWGTAGPGAGGAGRSGEHPPHRGVGRARR